MKEKEHLTALFCISLIMGKVEHFFIYLFESFVLLSNFIAFTLYSAFLINSSIPQPAIKHLFSFVINVLLLYLN